MHRLAAVVVASLGAVTWMASVSAAEPPPRRAWDLAIHPYVWAAGVDATFELDVAGETIDAEVDESFRDILRDLELGAMGLVDARYRRLVLLFDGFYTKVGDASDVLRGAARLDSDLTQVILDTKLGFRVLDTTAPWADPSSPDGPRLVVDVLGGVRYWYNGLDVDLETRRGDRQRLPSNLSPSKDWWDPVVGARIAFGITRTLNVSVIGDVGGFDVGNASELTWMVLPSLNWRPWERWSFHAGYKHLDTERERPSRNRELGYTLSGPVLGVGFHF